MKKCFRLNEVKQIKTKYLPMVNPNKVNHISLFRIQWAVILMFGKQTVERNHFSVKFGSLQYSPLN